MSWLRMRQRQHKHSFSDKYKVADAARHKIKTVIICCSTQILDLSTEKGSNRHGTFPQLCTFPSNLVANGALTKLPAMPALGCTPGLEGDTQVARVVAQWAYMAG